MYPTCLWQQLNVLLALIAGMARSYDEIKNLSKPCSII